MDVEIKGHIERRWKIHFQSNEEGNVSPNNEGGI